MGNHGCIAVGINRYHFFQPLNHAQADAQALRQFLVDAGWSSDRCLLLTDTSLPIAIQEGSSEEIYPSYPTKENILNLVKKLLNKHTDSGDLLWFFFIGYGVNWQEEDYLMPIDGNPSQIAETGIPIKWLFDQLKASHPKSVLVLLDINRSQGLYGTNPVGIQTVELAQKLEIPTILSCQLDQFSHEAAGLGHGLFTAGLLEALRYDRDITLNRLDWYLRSRLPELSAHHWRPAQTPLCVTTSPEENEWMLLHAYNNAKIPVNTPLAAVAVGQPSITNSYNNSPEPQLQVEGSKHASQSQSVNVQLPTAVRVIEKQLEEPVVVEPEKEPIPVPSVPPAPAPIEQPSADTAPIPLWQQLLFWVGGALLVSSMIAGVYLRNQDAFTGKEKPINRANAVSTTRKVETTQSSAPVATPAQTESNSSQPAGENISASTVTPKSSLPPKSAKSPNLPNQRLLSSTTSTQQASQFNKAIAQAKKIPPGDPQYEKAQQGITNWSKEIFNIAQNRARQGDFAGAVAAAKLVPEGQPVYLQAQQAIQEWQAQKQQQSESQILLQAAKGLIRPGNAVSYSHAIIVAKKAASDQVGSAEAKKLTDQWSQAILSLAQSRANKGRFPEAIAAASLIPEDAASHERAKTAIARWQTKQAKLAKQLQQR